MNRLLMYPFAGAAMGVLAAVVIVPVMGGGAPDTAAITLFVGTFLAGSGAIAGALVGVGAVLKGVGRAPATEAAAVLETEGAPLEPLRD